jgi:hypothetical protein
MRFDRNTLSKTECVTKMTVKRSCSHSASRSLFNWKRVISSSAANGSSIRRTRGRVTSPRAIETRIFMPPDSSRGTASSKPLRLTCASTSFTCGAAAARDTPCSRSGSQTLSNTVAQGISVGSWKTKPISAFPIGGPRQSRIPEVGDDSPATSRSAVDLPHPDGPSRLRKSPWLMVMSTSRSATTSFPKVLPTDRRISCGPPVFALSAVCMSTRKCLSGNYFFRSRPTPLFTNSSV